MAPSIGRIQKRKTNLLQIIIFGLQRAAGPYRRARTDRYCGAKISNTATLAKSRCAVGARKAGPHTLVDVLPRPLPISGLGHLDGIPKTPYKYRVQVTCRSAVPSPF